MAFYEEDVRGYVSSFNGEDFDGVAGRLGDDLEISVNGSVAMRFPQDRDAILGSYKADFAIHKRVEISREPETTISDDDGEAHVSLELSYDTPEGQHVSLDVVYVYNTQTKKQRRHLISNIKMSESTKK
jgi:hypothetical protein